MKKSHLTIVVGIIMSLSTYSQNSELKAFKVDISIGYAAPVGTGSDGGFVFSIEPKYAIASRIALGLRLEGAGITRFTGYDSNGNPNNADVKAIASYLATCDFYLSENYHFRPFVGAGAGYFELGSVSTDSYYGIDDISYGSKFGGMVRAGFEASHFRLGIECNIIPKTTFSGYDQNGNASSDLISKNSYLGFKLGVCLGGGPKK